MRMHSKQKQRKSNRAPVVRLLLQKICSRVILVLQINLSEDRIINAAFSVCRESDGGQVFFSVRDIQRLIFLEEGHSVKSSAWKDVQRIIPGAKISSTLRKHPAFVALDGIGRRAAKFRLVREVYE